MEDRTKRDTPHYQRRKIKVNYIRNKNGHGAEHTFNRKSTREATDADPCTEISGITKKASPVDRQISKVKFDHKQSTVASLSRRRNSSSIPAAESQKPAVQMQVTGEHGRDCTQVQPTYKTGYKSRINPMYKSSFGEKIS